MSCICCHSCPFTLRVELNFSHYVMIFWWLYHILECLQRTAIGLDWTKVTASCGMWLNREEKVWWCGASQPSLISYAACLVSSRLRLLSKHEYVTLQWVGALPSLKHISSHSPLLFLFFFFSLSFYLVWLREELRWTCRECPTMTFFFLAQRGRKGNRTVHGQEACKSCAFIWDKSVNCNITMMYNNIVSNYPLTYTCSMLQNRDLEYMKTDKVIQKQAHFHHELHHV